MWQNNNEIGRPPDGAPDWGKVKADYDGEALSVAGLCRCNGISISQLYRRVRQDGWRKRVERRSAWGAGQRMPRSTLDRLRNVISRRIRHIEDIPASRAKGETALESERQARAIAALVRALEQVVALEKPLEMASKESESQSDGDNPMRRAQLEKTLEEILGAGKDIVAEENSDG